MKEEKVIFARDAMIGETYLSKTGIAVTVVKKTPSAVTCESGISKNLIPVQPLYVLRIMDKKEVNEMAKKNAEKKARKQRASKVCIDYALIAPIINKGEPVKISQILEKVKVAKTNCSPYFRVYTTLQKAEKEGLVKFLGKGTFQKVGSNKKASTEKPEPKKEKKPKAKETAKKEEPKPKKAEPKKPEPKKPETKKKAEPKKPEAKKTEPKKVEEKKPEPKPEAPKSETSGSEAPKPEEPKPEQPKGEEAKTDGL